MTDFGCEFFDDAELSCLRLQYEVVCLGFVSGFVFELLSVCCQLLQRFVAFSHQGWAGQSMARDVMGDMYRCRNDASKLRHVQFVESFSPDVCAADVAPRVHAVQRWQCCSYCDTCHDAAVFEAQ